MPLDIQECWTLFPHSKEHASQMKDVAKTDQTQAPSYRLAYMDDEFLTRRELRSVRIGLEMLKPELVLSERGILSTVVMFGGARIPEPGQAALSGKNAKQKENLEANSRYYEKARRFARLCSEHSATTNHREFVVVTGGGPGVMEAGNRGAHDVGAPSIGLNIVLPHEQEPNRYITPQLCFNFHYFAIRKMIFIIRAKALAIFPGGFGTLDELFEALTLIQTGRMKRVPVLMFGKEFWHKAVDINFLAGQGTISPEDVDLLTYVDSAEEGWQKIREFYQL